MLSPITLMEIAIAAYMLLGSTSLGYLLIRMGYPNFRTLEIKYKTGWSIITGIAFTITTTTLAFGTSFLLKQKIMAFELLFISIIGTIISAIITFNFKRYFFGTKKVKVSVPKRAVVASAIAKKAFEKLGHEAYIPDKEAAQNLQEIISKIDRGEIAIKVDTASNLIPFTEEETKDKNVQEVLSKKVLLIGPPQKIYLNQEKEKLKEIKAEKQIETKKEFDTKEIIAKLKKITEKIEEQKEGKEKLVQAKPQKEQLVEKQVYQKDQKEIKEEVKKPLVKSLNQESKESKSIEQSLKSLKSIVESSEVMQKKEKKQEITEKPKIVTQNKEAQKKTEKVLEEIGQKIEKSEQKIVTEKQLKEEIEDTKRYIIESLKKDLKKEEIEKKESKTKPKVVLPKSAKILKELLSER
ncbi:MAG: hypothetical protein QXU92_03995 [Candidatus Diapherotrites archaeon]